MAGQHELMHEAVIAGEDYLIIIKGHFYACGKFMRICQNGPLDKDNYASILFLCSSALCIVRYGAIKIYAVRIYATCA